MGFTLNLTGRRKPLSTPFPDQQTWEISMHSKFSYNLVSSKMRAFARSGASILLTSGGVLTMCGISARAEAGDKCGGNPDNSRRSAAYPGAGVSRSAEPRIAGEGAHDLRPRLSFRLFRRDR